MGAFTDFLRRFSRPIKITIQIGILVVILAAIGTVGFIEYSAQPVFCTNCHYMAPYYESWTTSTHNDVPCIKCHYAPGIKAEAMGKLQAANQVVKYVTGAYGTKPWAEIEDASCLRSGCHSERKLEGEVIYKGIRFDHTQHLGELRRGKQLRCTSCHSQIVQGEHLAVTETTCFLCHFKNRPAGEPIAGCTGCHSSPPRIVSPAGFVVEHEQYVEELVSCVSCHDQMTTGSGVADQSRCFTCHNEPERIAEFENTTLIHRNHIAVHNVTCGQCHLPIEHRIISLAETFELDCNSCHQGAHETQRLLYSGMGGHGTDNAPSSMFLARVSCQSCHGLPADVDAHESVRKAGEATCLSCHGIRYANILPAWQDEVERRLGIASSALRTARQLLGAAPVRDRATADSLLALATDNVQLVERGRGAHNIVYADNLLRAALELAQQAVAEGGLDSSLREFDLGPPVSENICSQCHLSQQRSRTVFDGREFDHERHVIEASLECTACHTPLEQHGETKLTSAAACDACHHSEPAQLDCESCHQGPGGAPAASIATAVGDFSHAVHVNAPLDCTECHSAPAMTAANLSCETCHDRHHQAEATCSGCHRDVLPKHTRAAHNGCSQCHGSAVEGVSAWSRQVCTTCHTDRVDHNAPVACDACHQVPAFR